MEKRFCDDERIPILLDVDGVLADVFSPLLARIGWQIVHVHPGGTSFFRDLFTSSERLCALLSRYQVYETAQPYPGVPAALRRLHQHCHITLVTARGWHPQAEVLTRQWFADHGMPYDRLFITRWPESKSQVYARTGERFALIVDDEPHNLDDASESGCVAQCLLRRQKWNRDVADYPAVSCLSEVERLIVPTHALQEIS